MARMHMPCLILPPGFRFHPTDEELINDYLKERVSSSSNPQLSIIANINIYKFNPWELPGKALFGENEWFFFSPRDRKYPNGARPNRTAASGYWKATGTDKPILTSNGSQCLGVKKALVFYRGRAPKGIKTNWIMLEYRLLDDHTHQLHKLMGSMRLDDWVLCRVRHKCNSLKLKEEASASSCENSPTFPLGFIQGQETILKRNRTLTDYKYDFQACLNPLESDQEGEGQVEFQEGSPRNLFSDVDSDSQPSPDSSFKAALESIKKVLSIGTFEELLPVVVPPKKRLHVSTSKHTENASIFQVSSTDISTSYQPRSFPADLIN